MFITLFKKTPIEKLYQEKRRVYHKIIELGDYRRGLEKELGDVDISLLEANRRLHQVNQEIEKTRANGNDKI